MTFALFAQTGDTIHWDSFLAGLSPALVAIGFAYASYWKARTAAIYSKDASANSKAAVAASDVNKGLLEDQNAVLVTHGKDLKDIAHQVTDECLVMKAHAAAQRIIAAAELASQKITDQAAAQAIVTAEDVKEKVKTGVKEAVKEMSDSQMGFPTPKLPPAP